MFALFASQIRERLSLYRVRQTRERLSLYRVRPINVFLDMEHEMIEVMGGKRHLLISLRPKECALFCSFTPGNDTHILSISVRL